MEKKALAVITARGGSKRIPRKNIKSFCGEPIISYSIKAALKSKVFSEVMVSTDDAEIADIACRYGAKVPFMRSKSTAGDYATTADVLMEVLNEYSKRGMSFDYMCCIYPTAPFVTANKLKEAMQVLKNSDSVEVMSVVPFSYPPQRCFVIDKDGKMEYKYKEFINTRSQDLEKQYHDAGQFYMYNIRKYLKLNGKISGDIMPIIVNEMEVQDIDNEEDWKLAELKYNIMNSMNK